MAVNLNKFVSILKCQWISKSSVKSKAWSCTKRLCAHCQKNVCECFALLECHSLYVCMYVYKKSMYTFIGENGVKSVIQKKKLSEAGVG